MKDADRLPWAEYCAICDTELDETTVGGLGGYLCQGCNHFVCAQAYCREETTYLNVTYLWRASLGCVIYFGKNY